MNRIVKHKCSPCSVLRSVMQSHERASQNRARRAFVFIKLINYFIDRSKLGVDRYVFFRADTDTDYYRSSRPITDILNRYTCLV